VIYISKNIELFTVHTIFFMLLAEQ